MTNNNLWIPNTIFSDFKISHYYLGSIKSDSTIGPAGGSAISTNKILAIKKSIGESLDRRSSMIGHNKLQNIPVMDLVSGKKSSEPLMEYSLLNSDENIIDTTGTSAHFNDNLAIQYSLNELFQKNALFLIWYKQRGHLLENHEIILSSDKDTGIKTFFIENRDFYPFINVLAIQIDTTGKTFFGMGTDKKEKKASKKAYEELKLLRYENAGYWSIYEKNISFDDYSMGNASQRNYLPYLFNGLHEDTSLNLSSAVGLWKIPSFIKSLKLAVLPNTMYPYMHVVKCKSDQLLTHLPLKNLLLKFNDFQKIPITTNISEIVEKPSCPSL